MFGPCVAVDADPFSCWRLFKHKQQPRGGKSCTEEERGKEEKERAALEAKRNRPIAWCTECKAVCEEGTSFKCQDCGHYKRDHLSGDEAKQAAMAAGSLSPMLSPKEHKQTLNTTATPSKHDEDLPPLDPNDPVSVGRFEAAQRRIAKQKAKAERQAEKEEERLQREKEEEQRRNAKKSCSISEVDWTASCLVEIGLKGNRPDVDSNTIDLRMWKSKTRPLLE
eukprot:g944.t1